MDSGVYRTKIQIGVDALEHEIEALKGEGSPRVYWSEEEEKDAEMEEDVVIGLDLCVPIQLLRIIDIFLDENVGFLDPSLVNLQ